MIVIDERFTSDYNLEAHYEKHKNQYPGVSIEQYEKTADVLQRSPIDNRNIFGYVNQSKDDRIAMCKYNKATQDFVVYAKSSSGEPLTITMYKKSWQEYTGDKSISYYDEIDE